MLGLVFCMPQRTATPQADNLHREASQPNEAYASFYAPGNSSLFDIDPYNLGDITNNECDFESDNRCSCVWRSVVTQQHRGDYILLDATLE